MAVEFINVDYFYNFKTSLATQALFDINLKIEDQQITTIIGHTGSGKSTLIQQINGLMLPTHGQVIVNDQKIDINTKNKQLSSLRAQVGMSFQFAENQMFSETVIDDVMFGPKNFGFDNQHARQAAEKALQLVGLSEDKWDQSPFDLSGGQMRKAAIAGILSYDPNIAIFDEPTAGLDPDSSEQIINLLLRLKKQGKTVILITHDLDLVWQVADKVVVLNKGRLAANDTPDKVFSNNELLDQLQLKKPIMLDLLNTLNTKQTKKRITNFDQLAKMISGKKS